MKPIKAGTLPDPGPETIKSFRTQAGLTQTEAAELIHAGLRAWQEWEHGNRKMGLAQWELFLIKTKQVP